MIEESTIRFIIENGEHRFPDATYDALRGSETIAIQCTGMDEELLSVAVAAVVDGELVALAVATHKDFRRLGFGRTVLNDLLVALKHEGITPRASVAEDNLACLALMKSVELFPVESVQATRSSGPYLKIIHQPTTQPRPPVPYDYPTQAPSVLSLRLPSPTHPYPHD